MIISIDMMLMLPFNNNPIAQDFNVFCAVTLDQLNLLVLLEDSHLHIDPTCVPTTEVQVDRVVNLFQDNFNPFLTHHHYAIRILSSFLDTASGGVLANNVVADEDSMGSTNTGYTASLDELAISFFPGAGGGRSVSSFKPLHGSGGGIQQIFNVRNNNKKRFVPDLF